MMTTSDLSLPIEPGLDTATSEASVAQSVISVACESPEDPNAFRKIGKLPLLVDPWRESTWSKRIYSFLAIAVALFFLAHAVAYFTPANGGVDQNGYLLGGKLFSKTLSMRFAPVRPGTDATFDPHQFIGPMWVGTDYGKDTEAFYPKYPLGYPFLISVVLWCSSAEWGPIIAYWINPVAMTIACLATFFLARRFMHSLAALLAMIVFATSPVTEVLMSNPNSHATAVCCVTCGMLALVSWWQRRGAWRAFLAGSLLGYACTIRYTEGALILPIAFVALMNLRFRDWRSWRECGWVFFGWAVPIIALVSINYAMMGTITGYDQTNESTGFKIQYAADNWETLLRQLNTFGLAYVFPLSLAAIAYMFWWNGRVATWLLLWVGPCLLTYLFYYWAPNPAQIDILTVSYTRFFLTIFPALSIATFWFLDRVTIFARRWQPHSETWRPAVSVAAWVGLTIAAFTLISHIPEQPSFQELRWMVRTNAVITVITWIAAAVTIGSVLAALVMASLLGRSTLAWFGTGALAGAVILMQMEASMAQLEKNLIDQRNLAISANEVEDVAPAGSVLFLQESTLASHIQFVGDYRVYNGQTFNQGYVQSQNSPNLDSRDPQLLDPARRQALYERLKSMDQKQLDDDERKLVEQSLDSNLRVFALLPRRDGPAVSRKPQAAPTQRNQLRVAARQAAAAVKLKVPDTLQRALSADKFETEVVATWNTCEPRTEQPGAFKSRGMHFATPANPPTRWYQLLEIKRKPPAAPAPAKPVEKPAEKPLAPKPAPKPVPQPIQKPVEPKPVEVKPPSTAPAASKSVESKPPATVPMPADKSPETKPTEVKSIEAKPATTLPAVVVPAETKPPTTSLTAALPATKPVEPKPAEATAASKPVEVIPPKPAAPVAASQPTTVPVTAPPPVVPTMPSTTPTTSTSQPTK